MDSHIPNKPTLIAAAIYGACTQIKVAERELAWSELSDAQRKPFVAAAEFLSGQTFGVAIQQADRAKLTTGLAKIDLASDATLLVSIYISLASALPSA